MNKNSPSIKRILADVREISRHPSPRYFAAPLEENLFEWHFTIRGPAGSDFEGGVYHGRILLPPEYPFKPPNIIFLTKNGRFEVGTKICLSISAFHEETWQPAWGIRTMLEAIISFLPTPGGGAIGALDWTREERQALAKQSVSFTCAQCCPAAPGTSGLPPVSSLLPQASTEGSNGEDSSSSGSNSSGDAPSKEMQEQIRQLHLMAPVSVVATPVASAKTAPSSNSTPATVAAHALNVSAGDSPASAPPSAEASSTPSTAAAASRAVAAPSAVTRTSSGGGSGGGDVVDRLFLLSMAVVALLIAFLIGRKLGR